MESLADALFVVVSVLTIALYSGLLILGADPGWALVIVLGGALVLGVLLNSALAILRETTPDTTTKPAATPDGSRLVDATKHAADGSQPGSAPGPLGERA